ncbi:unnamed protein product [Parajaminaea phylloscopi]
MVGLEQLPVELLYEILVYSGSAALPITSKLLQRLLCSAPNSVRASYLLARWHEAYNYTTLCPPESSRPPRPSKRIKLSSDGRRSRESQVSNSQSYWPSRFIPVLPVADSSSNTEEEGQEDSAQQHRCSHYVLNYCLRFPICNHIVLEMIEDRLLTEEQYGNIVAAAALPLSDLPNLQEPMSSPCASDAPIRGKGRRKRSTFFPVTELPQRLFGDFQTASTTLSLGSAEGLNHRQDLSGQSDDGESADDPSEFLKSQLEAFGPIRDVPPLADLLLILRVLLLHCQRGPQTVDSHEGYGLAKAVFARQQLLMGLLLACGADPQRKQGLSYTVACKANWVEGARLLIEREDRQTARAWRHAKRALAAWLSGGERQKVALEQWRRKRLKARAAAETDGCVKRDDEQSRKVHRQDDRERHSSVTSKHLGETGSTNGGHAHDRVPVLPSRLLRLSIQNGASDVAEWLRKAKGVFPDLKTLRLLDDMARQRSN